MEQNKQKEEKPEGVFSQNEREILAALSRHVDGLCQAVDRLTTQVMNLTGKIQKP